MAIQAVSAQLSNTSTLQLHFIHFYFNVDHFKSRY